MYMTVFIHVLKEKRM
jgi:hypothetical protein